MRIASGVEEKVEQEDKGRIKLAIAGAALIAGGAQCQGEAGDALTLEGATVLCVAAAREMKPENNVPQMRAMMNRRDGAGGGRDERYRERSRSRDDADPPVPDATPTPTDVASETGPGWLWAMEMAENLYQKQQHPAAAVSELRQGHYVTNKPQT